MNDLEALQEYLARFSQSSPKSPKLSRMDFRTLVLISSMVQGAMSKASKTWAMAS